MTTYYTYPAPTPTKGNRLSDIAEGPEGLTQDLALSLNRPAIERPKGPGKSQPRKLDEEARNQETEAVKSYGGFCTFA